jgi:hypothetical protein
MRAYGGAVDGIVMDMWTTHSTRQAMWVLNGILLPILVSTHSE